MRIGDRIAHHGGRQRRPGRHARRDPEEPGERVRALLLPRGDISKVLTAADIAKRKQAVASRPPGQGAAPPRLKHLSDTPITRCRATCPPPRGRASPRGARSRGGHFEAGAQPGLAGRMEEPSEPVVDRFPPPVRAAGTAAARLMGVRAGAAQPRARSIADGVFHDRDLANDRCIQAPSNLPTESPTDSLVARRPIRSAGPPRTRPRPIAATGAEPCRPCCLQPLYPFDTPEISLRSTGSEMVLDWVSGAGSVFQAIRQPESTVWADGPSPTPASSCLTGAEGSCSSRGPRGSPKNRAGRRTGGSPRHRPSHDSLHPLNERLRAIDGDARAGWGGGGWFHPRVFCT